jgi:hypothetical protein
MSGESQSYLPEDVLQAEGENKGNIADTELARVGAEAEEKRHNSLTSKFMEITDPIVTNADAEKLRIKNKGVEAMRAEVRRRASASEAAEGISPEAKASFAFNAGSHVEEEEEKLTKERIQEEVRKAESK